MTQEISEKEASPNAIIDGKRLALSDHRGGFTLTNKNSLVC